MQFTITSLVVQSITHRFGPPIYELVDARRCRHEITNYCPYFYLCLASPAKNDMRFPKSRSTKFAYDAHLADLNSGE